MNRRFERMFPDIVAGEKAFEKDLLSHGKMAANHNRQLRERGQDSTDSSKGQIIGTFFFDFEKGEERFVAAPGYEHLSTPQNNAQ